MRYSEKGHIFQPSTMWSSQNGDSKMKPWTIKQLKEMLIEDLKLCQTELEISNCKSIARREIREQAREFSKERRLTPSEVAILEDLGIEI